MDHSPHRDDYDKKVLFDEFTIIKTNLQKNQKIKSFNTLDEIWTYVFQTAGIDGDFPNLKIVVEFLMCIRGSNANVEQIFSDMNVMKAELMLKLLKPC